MLTHMLSEADYSSLRSVLGKDENHIESIHIQSMEEEEYYPAGSIVVLRDGRLGMAETSIWQPHAFEEARGARQARSEEGDLPFAATYIGTHGEELLGAMGTVLVETNIRVQLLEGDNVDDDIIYVERGEIAWVLETPSEELQRIYINLVRWALEENMEVAWRTLRSMALLAPFQLWKKDIEEELLLLLAPLAHLGVRCPVEDIDKEIDKEVEQMKHAQAPAQPQQQAQMSVPAPAPQPQAQQPRAPRGPHAVIVDEGNRVLAFAPFEPVWRGQRYSIPPTDERIRKLAEKCQQLRAEGRNVALRFIVTPAS